MINKKLFIFIVCLLLVNSVIVQSEDHEYDSQEFYRDSNPKEWDKDKIKWPLVPVEKIKDIPVDKLIYSELSPEQKKSMTPVQIEAKFGEIGNLNDVDKTNAIEAVYNKYKVDIISFGQSASLKEGILKATFGVQGQLDLSNKEGWKIEIDDKGNIQHKEGEINENQISTADSFFILNKAKFNTESGKSFEVMGLSVKDGGYYIRHGDIGFVDNYKIDAFNSDVNIIFDGGKKLELLKIQTELNNAWQESKRVWTSKIQALYNQRESIKNQLGLKQASSSQILAGIDGSNQNSVIFDTNSILVNGNGFRVTDSVKLLAPKGGSILGIARDDQPTLYNKIKGNGGITNGNFDYTLGEQVTMGVNPYLSKPERTESITINNENDEPISTVVSPEGDGIIVEKGKTACYLIGCKQAVAPNTIYKLPNGVTKRGDEMTPEDFKRLPPGTRIFVDPDFANNPVEVSKNPQPYDERTKNLNNAIKPAMVEVAKTLKVPLTLVEVEAICKVESCKTEVVECRVGSCGPYQTTFEAVVEAGTRFKEFGTKIKVDDMKELLKEMSKETREKQLEKKVEYLKTMSVEDLATAGVLHYGIVKKSISSVCETCSEDTKLKLALIANNLGPTATIGLITSYKNEYDELPKTTADFKNYLTAEKLKPYFPTWTKSQLNRKIGIVNRYPDDVRKAMRR